MNAGRTLESLDVEIPRTQVVRLLGMHRRKRSPRESVLRCLEEEQGAARDLVEARAVWTVIREGLPGSAFIDPKVPIAVAVCTIGDALEERVARLTRGGDSARAMIADAFGSAAAEAVADRVNGRICDRAIRAGLTPDRRRSPGYGRWDLREQRLIFERLQPAEIGVTLNADCMMIPRKSISFLVPLTGGRTGDGGGRCSRCGFVDCEYREL